MNNLQPGRYWYSGSGYGKSKILVEVTNSIVSMYGTKGVRFSEGSYPCRMIDIPSSAKFEPTNSSLPLGTIKQ